MYVPVPLPETHYQRNREPNQQASAICRRLNNLGADNSAAVRRGSIDGKVPVLEQLRRSSHPSLPPGTRLTCLCSNPRYHNATVRTYLIRVGGGGAPRGPSDALTKKLASSATSVCSPWQRCARRRAPEGIFNQSQSRSVPKQYVMCHPSRRPS